VRSAKRRADDARRQMEAIHSDAAKRCRALAALVASEEAEAAALAPQV
jgi:hypothetical protein